MCRANFTASAQIRSRSSGRGWARGELDHLLVAALHGAVPLVEMDDVALAVGEDLHLDVAGLDDGLLQEHRGVAERGGGLAGRCLDGLPQLGGVLHPAHAPAAAARDRLHEHGEADFIGGAHEFVDVVGGRGGAEDGNSRLPGGGHRARLVAGQLQDAGVGADEGDARVGAGLGQLGILRQESVARVDGVGAGARRARSPRRTDTPGPGVPARRSRRPRRPSAGAASCGPRRGRRQRCAHRVRSPRGTPGSRSRRGWRRAPCGTWSIPSACR